MSYDEIIAALRALCADDFEDGTSGLGQLYALTEALLAQPAPERAIPEIFALFERLPDCDLGAPGPLVHTLEKLPYEAELVASLGRRPTHYSVWLLNRILNGGPPAERRRHWLDLLAAAAHHPLADDVVRDSVVDFLHHQALNA